MPFYQKINSKTCNKKLVKKTKNRKRYSRLNFNKNANFAIKKMNYCF